jgi:tight adherence protein C
MSDNVPQNRLTMEMLLPAGVTPDDFLVLVSGVLAFLVVFLVGNSLIERDTLTARVKALHERRSQLKSSLTAPRRRTRGKSSSIGVVKAVVMKFKLLQQTQTDKVQSLLLNAGWRSKDAIYIYVFFQLVTPIGLFVLAFLVVNFDFSQLPWGGAKWKWLVILGMAYIGAKLPVILAVNARNKRYETILKGLPDGLDLMMICAEAGLSLSASLDRVSRELNLAYPELAEELGLTSIELGFLPDRKKALMNLAERVNMQEIRGISSVLIQTEKYGTPISQALRVLSAEFRTQRMLRAEQKAARLPAIMTVPMIVFILPTLFVVIISPAVIKLLATN